VALHLILLHLTLYRLSDLTEADVLAWVYAELGAEQLAAIEDGLSANIEEQKAPKVVAGTPW
jgi:hypothetical protein